MCCVLCAVCGVVCTFFVALCGCDHAEDLIGAVDVE